MGSVLHQPPDRNSGGSPLYWPRGLTAAGYTSASSPEGLAHASAKQEYRQHRPPGLGRGFALVRHGVPSAKAPWQEWDRERRRAPDDAVGREGGLC